MCGINGIVRLDPHAPPVDRDELVRTRDAMRLRGPDDEGSWLSPDGGIGLGHRRLAIIDLSPGGRQPMARDGGRYRIVFNGEIYNYRRLRDSLIAEGVSFRSQSDTEVILALYAREGSAMLPRLRGMYALALWDEREGSLLLARDPYGIKPLYYEQREGALRFASQVKALEAGGGARGSIDSAGLVGFLLWGSVPEPHTLRRGVFAVPSGHHIVVRDGRVSAPLPHHRFERPEPGGAEVVPAFEESVRDHLEADVPVAIFLSAGMDSTLIAALAQRYASEPLTTLTMRFDILRDTPLDEAPLAAEVARTLGTRHVDCKLDRSDFDGLWPQALEAMDQPTIDGFNTFVVSRAAAQEGFKVVLSGLGGDELLGSYDSFRDVPRWCRWASGLQRVPGLRRVWPSLARALLPKQPKLAGMLELGATLPGAYFLRRGLFLPWELPRLMGESLACEGLAAYDPVADASKCLGGGQDTNGSLDPWEAVHRMESTQYMRNQLLRDSDWASMAHSVELRVPLVDAQLREVVAGAGFEPGRSGGKAALVRRAAPELPDALWSRPKSGFFVPVMQWLGEELNLKSGVGLVSRRLALMVLDAFGVDLRDPGSGRDPIP